MEIWAWSTGSDGCCSHGSTGSESLSHLRHLEPLPRRFKGIKFGIKGFELRSGSRTRRLHNLGPGSLSFSLHVGGGDGLDMFRSCNGKHKRVLRAVVMSA